MVQFAKQKHFDAGSCFFLTSIEAGGKHLCVVENKKVVRLEVAQNVAELLVLNFSRLAVEHHHTAIVAMRVRIRSYLLLREVELELREFHIFSVYGFSPARFLTVTDGSFVSIIVSVF